jgi:hypothetical protein
MNEKCFGEAPLEPTGMFPSPLDLESGITWFVSDLYLFTHYDPLPPNQYPHRTGYPPFSQLCTSFQAILREVFELEIFGPRFKMIFQTDFSHSEDPMQHALS